MSKEAITRTRSLPPQGVYTANWIPYGYKYNPDTIEMLEIDDQVSDAVIYIFSESIDGKPMKDIIADLEEMGYPTPQRRKQQLGLATNGKNDAKIDTWVTTAFNQVLFNPIYAGDMIQQGKVWDCVYYYSGQPLPEGSVMPIIEENHHPALISREDMKRACEVYLSQKTEKAAPAARSSTRSNAISLALAEQEDTSFAALLHCGECGKQMLENEIRIGPAISFLAYTCSSLTASSSKCTNRFYRQDEILPTLISFIEAERKQAQKAIDQIGSEEEKGDQYQRVEAFLQKQIDSAVDGVRKNMTTASKLKSKNRDGKITDEELKEELLRMEEENRGFEKQVMSALIRIRAFRASCTLENPWLSAYASLPEEFDPLADTVLLHQLVDRIDLYPDKPPVITLANQDEKQELLDVLYMPLRNKKQ